MSAFQLQTGKCGEGHSIASIEEEIMYTRLTLFRGCIAFAVCLILSIMNCSKSGTGGVDTQPAPPAVDDLRVTSMTTISAALNWSAPGDSGKPGNAVMYDMRCSEDSITAGNWNAAIECDGEPGMNFPAMPQSMVIEGLNPGTKYYFAIKSKNSDDKWSALSNVPSATTQVNISVNFPDTALNRIIRQRINKPTGTIYKSDLVGIDSLTVTGKAIVDLAGLDACVNLGMLNLSDNQITDISPLSSVSNLIYLYMNNNKISNLAPLSGLHNLQRLSLVNNLITDLTPLAGLTNLTELDLSDNQIADISHLAGLTNLGFLFLRNNQIVNISAVSGMTNLFNLVLGWNSISDITPIASITSLVQFDLQNNQVSDITPLTNLTKLNRVTLQFNQITDISALLNNTGLGSGDNICLFQNPLSEQAIADQQTLISRGVTFNC